MRAYQFDEQEDATVLAAYQMQGLADEQVLRPDEIHEIATGGDDSIISLPGEGIDRLCERLNRNGADANAALQLACRRAEAELGRWPENDLDSTEHRAPRYALGQYQAAIDALG